MDAEAHGESETLARHERTLIELAKRQKLNITEIYREVVSGDTIAARPIMQRLLQEVEQGIWSGVLVMEVERLARGDTIDQGIMAQTFKYSNTKIVTPMKTYDPNNEFDEEYFEFGLFMSRREYKTITRRLQRGRLASVKEGKFVGNKTPYGYVRKKLENEKGFTLVPLPDEAEVIKLIYDLYANGEQTPDGTSNRLGVSKICRKLNNLKIPPKYTDAWVPATIRDILINPVYNGKIRWNWRMSTKKMVDGAMTYERPRSAPEDCVVTNGLHEAIIDDKTWNLVQHLMKLNPPHPAPSQYAIKNPLSGIVYCGKCGRSMVRRPYSDHKKTPDTLMCPVTSCSNVSSALSLVEEHILKALRMWLEEFKIDYSINDEAKNENVQIDIKSKALKKLDEDIKNIDTQISNLHDLLEQGVYSTDMFLERSKLLSERKHAAKIDRDTLSKNIELEQNRKKTRITIIPRIQHVLAVYPLTDDPKTKNELLKEILERVNYVKELGTRWHGSPDDFNIELFPRIPK